MKRPSKRLKPPEVLCWAHHNTIVCTGPYSSQLEASMALQGLDGEPEVGSFVRAERKKKKS